MPGKTATTPVVEAVTTAGRSVIIAGSTVVIAVLGLCLTGLTYMYGVAISTSFAVLVMMSAAITLLPALLSYLGPKVDRLRIPLIGRALKAEGDARSPAARWSHRSSAGPGLSRSAPRAPAGRSPRLRLAAPRLPGRPATTHRAR